MVSDDLDGVLVRADGAVRTESVELALSGARLDDGNLTLDRERLEGDIVDDADGEAVLRLFGLEIIEDGHDLSRSGVLGRKTIAASDYERALLLALEEGLDIEVERLSERTGLLCAVEHRNPLDALRKNLEEVLLGEWTIEVDGDDTIVAALLGEVVDGLLGSFGNGTHGYDDVLRILGTVICEWTILPSGELADFAHVTGNDVRNGIISLVPGLDSLEINVAVLGCSAGYRSVRIERPLAEILETLLADHSAECILVERFDLLDLMRGSETVEEMKEWNAGFDGGQMCHGGEILRLLNRAGSEHGEAGLAAGHDILMVSEDGEGMGRKRAGRNMEDGRKHFAGNLVHVRNHEKEALRCGIGSCEDTGLEGSVNCA